MTEPSMFHSILMVRRLNLQVFFGAVLFAYSSCGSAAAAQDQPVTRAEFESRLNQRQVYSYEIKEPTRGERLSVTPWNGADHAVVRWARSGEKDQRFEVACPTGTQSEGFGSVTLKTQRTDVNDRQYVAISSSGAVITWSSAAVSALGHALPKYDRQLFTVEWQPDGVTFALREATKDEFVEVLPSGGAARWSGVDGKNDKPKPSQLFQFLNPVFVAQDTSRGRVQLCNVSKASITAPDKAAALAAGVAAAAATVAATAAATPTPAPAVQPGGSPAATTPATAASGKPRPIPPTVATPTTSPAAPTPVPPTTVATTTPTTAPAVQPGRKPATTPPTTAAPANGAPATCDRAKEDLCRSLVQGQIPWQMSADPKYRVWNPQNVDALCGCTVNAAATVQCFQDALYSNHNQWSAAINSCKASAVTRR